MNTPQSMAAPLGWPHGTFLASIHQHTEVLPQSEPNGKP
jgi:hypothetical protein